MNAAIQCLSNTEILTKKLLGNEWIDNINPILTKSGGLLLLEY